MTTIHAKSWKDFVEIVDGLRDRYSVHKMVLDEKTIEQPVNLLWRGQADEAWPLMTTLERASGEIFDVMKYLHRATSKANEIESFTGQRWHVPDYPDLEKEVRDNQDAFRVVLPAYDYLVYLRHHGFPSPLLDWTESPFIAAYFALIETREENPAVYCYIETPGNVKSCTGGVPQITVKGPYVTTHKRHFAQKAQYTVSTRWNDAEERHYFCPHESIFSGEERDQDLLFKIVLPIAERRSSLTILNDYNINHFTLFQSEDSMIKALATKQFVIGGA